MLRSAVWNCDAEADSHAVWPSGRGLWRRDDPADPRGVLVVNHVLAGGGPGRVIGLRFNGPGSQGVAARLNLVEAGRDGTGEAAGSGTGCRGLCFC